MNLEINFANPAQKQFYYATERNQCFSGGFNNGKSYSGCLKAFTLLSTFPNYRIAIARQTRADLMKTTYQTFFKICPREIIETDNKQDGVTILKNGSQIYWMHLDKVEDSTLRGLEINSVLVDQAEEIDEKADDILDARVGRWDEAIIPQALLDAFPDWPKNAKTGKLIAPSYKMLLCNPDTQYHFIYRKYHPDSLERRSNYFYCEGEWDAGLGSSEGYIEALKHDEEWIAKYVKGGWGVSNAQIHRVNPNSIIDYNPDLLTWILRKGNLYRSMDHGESSPTCCLWWASIGGVYICYREYYVGNKIISDHRQAINDLSAGESYTTSYADPSIFDTESKKRAGFWSISDEYITKNIPSPPIVWTPADNNEFATRNRINELLRTAERFTHPVTKEPNSPGIYFIKKSPEYEFGCFNSINQLQSQRRVLIGYFEGKAVYDDARDEKVTDHAYDPIRYFIGMHGQPLKDAQRKIPRNSMKWFKMMAKKGNSKLTAASVNLNG